MKQAKKDAMKRTWTGLAVAAALAVAYMVGLAQGQQLLFVPPDKAPLTEVIPGVSKAVLWGEDNKGPYGAFTKFVPGHDVGMHTHTNDIWIVGIKGAYLYKDEAGEKRVGSGSFLRVPGGKKHWSGGDAKEGALFYEESTGKFDTVPAK